MSDLKMGLVIEEIRNTVEKPTLFGRVKAVAKRVFAGVFWRLVGRRAAIKRMKQLALSNSWRPTVDSLEAEQRRIVEQRQYLDSLKVLPTPDTHDVN